MICSNCQRGADNISYITSLNIDNSPFKMKETLRIFEDFINKAKTLHAQCQSIDCFCQHRINNNVGTK